jgi:hypothetical protein
MSIELRWAFLAAILSAFATSALAEDCPAARSAMLETGHRPVSKTVTQTDAHGKQTVTREVQTETNKYVQTADGTWHSMNIAIKDLNDLSGAKLTCQREGSDTVNGESTSVYEVHMDDEGTVKDMKVWISSKNLILKAEGKSGGTSYTVSYDFSHVVAPAGAIPMGGR